MGLRIRMLKNIFIYSSKIIIKIRHVKKTEGINKKTSEEKMAIEVENQNEGQLSPEKEQEIANRILKRAELAQMTRQLKLNLSKVPTPNVSGNGKGAIFNEVKIRRKKIPVNNSGDSEIKEAMRKVSPVKTWVGHESKENQGNGSPVKSYKILSTPPPAPPVSSSSSIRDDDNEEKKQLSEVPTTPRRVKNHNVPPVIISSANDQDNAHNHLYAKNMAMVTTPKRSANGNNPHFHRDENENEVGADLLMYLATSPYTSSSNRASRSGNHIGLSRVPTTPRASTSPTAYMSHGSGHEDEDAIRFSHMKPSMSSPQSTFKVPMHVVNHHHLPTSASASYSEVLMDSPSLYMATSPSPQKRRHTNLHDHPSSATSNGLLPHIPSTPSRELRTTSGSTHLLKTPNFNMGDYVHNLFSPSPRVTTTATTNGNSAAPTTTAIHDMHNGKV